MTTFGGDIFAWSESRATSTPGRGSKTTVVYTPPKRVYDGVGNVEAVAAGAQLGRGPGHAGTHSQKCRRATWT
jgi:hypothetical protein